MIDELGAHVSSAGGVQNAPERARLVDSVVLQLFSKMASRWAEPEITEATAAAFRQSCADHGIVFTAAHDSYLINLATADPVLFERSFHSFVGELKRSALLGLDAVVTHPGNATDGNFARAVRANAEAVQRALDIVPGETMVLFETTAGAGTALGASFEQLAELLHIIDATHAERMGVCVDTCHIWAAGYDLRDQYVQVMQQLDEIIGLKRVRLFHLNDSAGGLASRRDRHAHIGDGFLGGSAFARLLQDSRLMSVPKVIETPKDEDVVAADRRNLARLRELRRANKYEFA
ncbi:MAG TPA: deoxyribonuclease IV [Longimicrobiales bacterium]